jgi:hypothetical protein
MRRAVATLDRALGTLAAGVRRLGLDAQTTLIVTSDHGMAPVSESRSILLDDYIDVSTVDVIESGGFLALAPRQGVELMPLYQRLRNAHPRLRVYTRDEVPSRLHYSNNPRIAPIIGIPDTGWTVATRAARQRRHDDGRAPQAATHGFDPADTIMHAIFVAAGPELRRGLVVEPFENVDLYNFMCAVLRITPALTTVSRHEPQRGFSVRRNRSLAERQRDRLTAGPQQREIPVMGGIRIFGLSRRVHRARCIPDVGIRLNEKRQHPVRRCRQRTGIESRSRRWRNRQLVVKNDLGSVAPFLPCLAFLRPSLSRKRRRGSRFVPRPSQRVLLPRLAIGRDDDAVRGYLGRRHERFGTAFHGDHIFPDATFGRRERHRRESPLAISGPACRTMQRHHGQRPGRAATEQRRQSRSSSGCGDESDSAATAPGVERHRPLTKREVSAEWRRRASPTL